MTPILEVKDLVTVFDTESGQIKALDEISFTLHKQKTLGVVGESGCGKSVTSLSIMGLLPKPSGQVIHGEIIYNGENLLNKRPSEMSRIRGRKIAMIFQEPMTALNPVHRIGRQLGEVFQIHFPEMSSGDILRACVDLLEKVGIPDPEKRLREYVHQLSGGMRQRVMIAMALACKPDILIADEPTTALDVTIQAQILELLKDLQKEMGMSIMFITHDLGVIAQLCDEVVVMYAGKVVESGPIESLFKNPRHPYTKGLLDSIPKLSTPRKSVLKTIEGMVPALADMPAGCRFQNRCPYKEERCTESSPESEKVSEEHTVNCFAWEKLERA